MPVNELNRRGTVLLVQVLDVRWHRAPPARCAAARDGAVRIGAVSADYPSARAAIDAIVYSHRRAGPGGHD
jgi:hypothetical protein